MPLCYDKWRMAWLAVFFENVMAFLMLGATPYSSWYHPPTYNEALTQIYAKPATPLATPVARTVPAVPPITIQPSAVGPCFVPATSLPPPMTTFPPTPGWYNPPCYSSFVAEYCNRPQQPLQRPIHVSSPNARTHVVGRVERHIIPY